MTIQHAVAAGFRSGLLSVRAESTRRIRRNVPVFRHQFPPGPEGQRAYNTAYQRALRRQQGLRSRIRIVPVARADYPAGPDGFRAYRHDYFREWRKLRFTNQLRLSGL